ncbi:unnamed protein product [marine sediment metagenome]|uniref:Uncharacterized protein n=1 Tax=marine sediment metagenome TaxID=412755 RepID=X0RWT3_9ZZZZ
MLIIVIGLLILFGILGIILVPGIIDSQSWAKKTARKILESGRIDNPNEAERVSKVLSVIEGDREAADLWKHLQELKQRPEASGEPLGFKT